MEIIVVISVLVNAALIADSKALFIVERMSDELKTKLTDHRILLQS